MASGKKFGMVFVVLIAWGLAARAADPLADADQRIQKYRMREVEIQLKDGEGLPAGGIPVRAMMQRHEFLFGCNLFMLGQFPNPEENEKYEKRWSDLFNYATLPFYFTAYEPTPGAIHKDELKKMSGWCVLHNVTMKGHPLIWHEIWANPNWLPASPAEVEAIQKKRVEILVREFPEIQYWDLINEPTTSWKDRTPIAVWQNQLGPIEATRRAETWIRGANPDAKFLINDYNVSPIYGTFFSLTNPAKVFTTLLGPRRQYPFSFFAYLEALKKAELLPDAAGIQSHMHMARWPLDQVWSLCEKYARLGIPIHFTELTVLSGRTRLDVNYYNEAKIRPWPSTPRGEKVQADYVAKFYTLLFSHPSVQAITWWDFTDRNAWLKAPAGLLRADLSPKPAFLALKSLVREKWWTRFEGKTDASGKIRFRGFCGDYLLVLPEAGKEISFTIDCKKPEGQMIELSVR